MLLVSESERRDRQGEAAVLSFNYKAICPCGRHVAEGPLDAMGRKLLAVLKAEGWTEVERAGL